MNETSEMTNRYFIDRQNDTESSARSYPNMVVMKPEFMNSIRIIVDPGLLSSPSLNLKLGK